MDVPKLETPENCGFSMCGEKNTVFLEPKGSLLWISHCEANSLFPLTGSGSQGSNLTPGFEAETEVQQNTSNGDTSLVELCMQAARVISRGAQLNHELLP